jgi:hypothetical protein
MADDGQPLALTMEQMLTLESIFMPQAGRQRETAIKGQTKEGNASPSYLRFAHYTSAEAALSIIESKRVWMRNALCMPDYREVQLGMDYLRGFLNQGSNHDLFVSEFDQCASGAAQEALTRFDEWERDIRLDTYVSCISEHDSDEDAHGRLSMWRAFGSGTRVAIVLRTPLLSNATSGLRIIFSPVAYLNKAQAHGVIREVLKNVREKCDYLKSFDRRIITAYILTMLIAGVTCLKHEGFREEREWRAIYSPNRFESSLMKSCRKLVNGIPQIIYELPLDMTVSPDLNDLDFSRVFDRLIIGPSPYPWVLYKTFAAALKDAGIDQASERVHVSGIPLRA